MYYRKALWRALLRMCVHVLQKAIIEIAVVKRALLRRGNSKF